MQKSILERAAPPTFDVAVEMLERHKWHVYADVAAAVDSLLAGQNPGGQMRERAADGSILKYSCSKTNPAAAAADARKGGSSNGGSSQRVLPELRRPSGSAAGADVADADAASPGGFVRPRLFAAADGSQDAAAAAAAGTVTRRGRAVRLGCASPEGALLRLCCSDLDEERLWEVMSAMGLHDKVG